MEKRKQKQEKSTMQTREIGGPKDQMAWGFFFGYPANGLDLCLRGVKMDLTNTVDQPRPTQFAECKKKKKNKKETRGVKYNDMRRAANDVYEGKGK